MKFKAHKLLQIRKERRMSREDLAFEFRQNKLNCSSKNIYNLEKGESIPRVDDLSFLCQYFDKPVTYFFA